MNMQKHNKEKKLTEQNKSSSITVLHLNQFFFESINLLASCIQISQPN